MNKFSELTYEKPNYKQVKKELKKYVKDLKNAKKYNDFKIAFSKAEETYRKVLNTETICSIRNDMNKADKFYEEQEKYINEKGSSLQMILVSFYKTLIKSKFRQQFDEEYGNFLTKKIEYSLKLMKPIIIPLSIKENKLAQQYSKDAALCKCDFRGEECNFYGLLKHMESTDRQERKEAFQAWAKLYESVAEKLDSTFDKLVSLRVKKARLLGYKNYIDYIYLARDRYDYTKIEVEQFRNNVRDIIVPVCQELFNKQKERIGVDKLHFYDEALIFPDGNALPIGTKDELVAKAKAMYEDMSKETSEYFNYMCEHELFDLETRANKHLGGYCTCLPYDKAPFIFSNFNGTSADVDVLTHEAGHGFEVYVASRNQKSMLTVSSTSEINEIHSMSMEHFAYPYMKEFFGEKTNEYLYAHLCSSLTTIPYLVAVDEFQHRVFENPKMSAKERRDVWHKIEEIYLPWRDYDGNRFLQEGGFWMQKQHIFLYPFYYVDYALAQICAYQFFIRSLTNKEEAWNDYLQLCKKGGSLGYFDLLKSAKLDSPFEKETVEKVIGEVVKQIKVFEKQL